MDDISETWQEWQILVFAALLKDDCNLKVACFGYCLLFYAWQLKIHTTEFNDTLIETFTLRGFLVWLRIFGRCFDTYSKKGYARWLLLDQVCIEVFSWQLPGKLSGSQISPFRIFEYSEKTSSMLRLNVPSNIIKHLW